MTEQMALEIITNIVQRQNVTKENDLALSITQKAIEKQIPKKPKVNYPAIFCPYCRNHIITRLDGDLIAGRKQKCCDKCGQALDWSD